LEKIQQILYLVRYPVPQLDREVSISGGKSSNERVFPCLDCSFGGSHLVVVEFNKLQFALFLGEELLDMLRGLVVHDIELDPEPFRSEFVELLLLCFKNGNIVEPCN
jgi:hypothetical protein